MKCFKRTALLTLLSAGLGGSLLMPFAAQARHHDRDTDIILGAIAGVLITSNDRYYRDDYPYYRYDPYYRHDDRYYRDRLHDRIEDERERERREDERERREDRREREEYRRHLDDEYYRYGRY